MGHIELWCQRGVELMNMTPVAHNTLTMSNVEVSGHFVDTHFAAHSAAFVRTDVGKVFGPIVYALRGVAEDL